MASVWLAMVDGRKRPFIPSRCWPLIATECFVIADVVACRSLPWSVVQTMNSKSAVSCSFKPVGSVRSKIS